MRMRPKPTKKQSRQHMLLSVIKEKHVRTQEELIDSLSKFGFNVTQSSLSRDIAELGLVKQHGHYAIPPRHKQGSMPPITSIASAGPNLIVVKTLAGMAAPIGITIDEQKIPHTIGTVAGDDTVFLATAPGASHDAIVKFLHKLLKKVE